LYLSYSLITRWLQWHMIICLHPESCAGSTVRKLSSSFSGMSLGCRHFIGPKIHLELVLLTYLSQVIGLKMQSPTDPYTYNYKSANIETKVGPIIGTLMSHHSQRQSCCKQRKVEAILSTHFQSGEVAEVVTRITERYVLRT
jgi:hypothetical protein